MSEKLELEFKKRINSLQSSIETATGESYEDLTGAVKRALHIAEVMLSTTGATFINSKTVKSINFPLDMSGVSNIQEYFQGATNLKTMKGIKNTSHIRYFNRAFRNSGIVSIELPFNLSYAADTYASAFTQGAYYLEEIRFVTETIKQSISFFDNRKLSAESLQSITDGLATVETTRTLTLHADTKAKLTEEQIATITNKNWTIA